jgi:hypothetical protein
MKAAFILPVLLLSLASLSAQTTNPSNLTSQQQSPLTIHVAEPKKGKELPAGFLGLSYESSMLLPKDGKYYFDATNTPLVTLFQTLGIKNLRVGANAVDDPRVPVPSEKDIDALFGFAKAAGVKVIYSFRLKNGDPSRSAQLAKYIQEHYGDLLDIFAIGNEPDWFEGIRKNKDGYKIFYALWKPHYDAIIQAVPMAQIEGPSANGSFAINLAKDLYAAGHLRMVSSHYYVFGSGRKAEDDPAGTRDRFLSESNSVRYEKLYEATGKPLADLGVPYRIDEMNSCSNGGAKGSSDTYASALWALDWDHWWAAHGILGLNYHTGESVGMNGGFHAPNYASFVHLPAGEGFEVHPIAYSHLAFSQGAKGRILETQTEGNSNLTSYAYQDGSAYLITLINRTHDTQSGTIPVTITLPQSAGNGSWERLEMNQKNGDIAAKSDIALGDSSISSDGTWSGHWQSLPETASGSISVKLKPASATILRFTKQQHSK